MVRPNSVVRRCNVVHGYEDIVQQIYGYKNCKILDMIKDSHNIILQVGHRIRTGFDILNDFLEKVPVKEQSAIRDIYLFSAKHLLDKIQKVSKKSEKENYLQQIQTLLGDCANPVKEFLLQNALDNYTPKNEVEAKTFKTVIQREAIKKRIISEIKFEDGDKAEKANGLINSVLGKDSENHPDNKVPMVGERDGYPSQAFTIQNAYKTVVEKEAQQFINLMCLKDDQGNANNSWERSTSPGQSPNQGNQPQR